MGTPRPVFYRVQSSKFRVQMMCRIRDKFYLLDCFAALAMTSVGGRGNIFLNPLTTPPLRGTPPTEGNLVWCFIFLLCSINVSLGRVASCAYPRICSNCAAACFHILGFIARERSDRGDPVKSRAYARGINYWIATPSVMARNDKGVWGSVVILSWLL